jgi:phospholipid/cholesterol/gamma-HCH transport system substrate-binding protein
VKRRLQGVAFLAVVAALLGLTIAIYNKALPGQAGETVYLQADRAGNQLVVPADVKLDGVLVGRVAGVSTQGGFARLRMQIDSSELSRIPANVVARILPKTLVGEKYVQLVVPSAPTGHLRAGDIIPQDRSKTAIELQTVFTHLVPLLQTLKPAQLSVTLSNLASALRGRGDELGRNLVLVDQYFSKFNKDLPTFNHDIGALATTSSTYADAAPDLLRILHNFSVNAKTFTIKQDVYAQFLAGSRGFATTAARVFGDNANRLIKLANVSAPVLALYARYSNVLECLPNGLAIYDRTRLEQAFGGGPFLHITLTPVGDRGAYSQADRNLKTDLTSLNIPQNCYGLPYGGHGLHPVMARYPGKHPSDNYACGGYAGSSNGPPACPPANANPTAAGSSTGAGRVMPAATTDQGAVATPDEQQFVSGLLDPLLGSGPKPPSGLVDLLVGPMLRGMAVSVS